MTSDAAADGLLDAAFDFARDAPEAAHAAEIIAEQERLLTDAGLADLDGLQAVQRIDEVVRIRHVACATVLARQFHGVEVEEALAAFDQAKALIADACEHLDYEHQDAAEYEWDAPAAHPGFAPGTYARALDWARTLPR